MEIKLLCRATLCVCAMLLASCQMATPYQPKGPRGGYSDLRLDDNMFRVTFTGNDSTSAEHAHDLALLRAAELTLLNGYEFFVVVEQDRDSHISSVSVPAYVVTSGQGHSQGAITTFSASSVAYGGGQVNTRSSHVMKTIACFKERPSEGAYFSARSVYLNVGLAYGVDKTLDSLEQASPAAEAYFQNYIEMKKAGNLLHADINLRKAAEKDHPEAIKIIRARSGLD